MLINEELGVDCFSCAVVFVWWLSFEVVVVSMRGVEFVVFCFLMLIVALSVDCEFFRVLVWLM